MPTRLPERLTTPIEKAEAMIPFKSPLLLTVPPTLEKKLEALAALRTLEAQDEELVRQRRVAIAALRRDFDELQRDFATLRHRLASDARWDVMRALKYNPDQPRVSAGQPAGGQCTSGGVDDVAASPQINTGSSGDPSPQSLSNPVADHSAVPVNDPRVNFRRNARQYVEARRAICR
jgi:hypothetical protein